MRAECEESNQRCLTAWPQAPHFVQRSAQHDSNPGFLAVAKRSPELERRYFELVLRVVVEIRSSPVSFGLPIASTSLPV